MLSLYSEKKRLFRVVSATGLFLLTQSGSAHAQYTPPDRVTQELERQQIHNETIRLRAASPIDDAHRAIERKVLHLMGVVDIDHRLYAPGVPSRALIESLGLRIKAIHETDDRVKSPELDALIGATIEYATIYNLAIVEYVKTHRDEAKHLSKRVENKGRDQVRTVVFEPIMALAIQPSIYSEGIRHALLCQTGGPIFSSFFVSKPTDIPRHGDGFVEFELSPAGTMVEGSARTSALGNAKFEDEKERASKSWKFNVYPNDRLYVRLDFHLTAFNKKAQSTEICSDYWTNCNSPNIVCETKSSPPLPTGSMIPFHVAVHTILSDKILIESIIQLVDNIKCATGSAERGTLEFTLSPQGNASDFHLLPKNKTEAGSCTMNGVRSLTFPKPERKTLILIPFHS